MTRLIRVEILRLFSRRLVRIVGVFVLLLVAVIVAVDGYNSSNDTSAEITRFNEQRLAGYDEARAGFERDQQAGHLPKDVVFPTRAEAEADPQQCFPDPSTAESFNCTPPKQPYAVAAKLPDFGRAVAVICAIAAFLIGASAAGAEWAAGTMQSLLYWEPRPIRVVAAKILGLLVVTATVVVAAEALFTAAALLAGQTRGTTAGLTSGVWTGHLLLMLRAIGIAAFAGVLGRVAPGFCHSALMSRFVLAVNRLMMRSTVPAAQRLAWAMLVAPARRSAAMTVFRTAASAAGGVPVLAWEASSLKVVSRT